MPSQQADVAETIAGLKRAIKRQNDAPSTQPIVAASNRGNKLKQGARYVHEGTLSYMHGPESYKQKIEHAGYTRFILERNPRRYDEYGDELDDSEIDQEADEGTADENAYAGFKLEELLCPLKHPSELPVHPTMSHPYLSSALPDMVKSTQDKLRQERANLWRAKHLNRQLIGDESWMPCGVVESASDWNLFEPRKKSFEETNGVRKRKRENNPSEVVKNGGTKVMDHAVETGQMTSATTENEVHEHSSALSTARPSAEIGPDIPMPDAGHNDELSTEVPVEEKRNGIEAQAAKTDRTPDNVQEESIQDSDLLPETNGIDGTHTTEVEDTQSVEDKQGPAVHKAENAETEAANGNGEEQSPKHGSEPDDATPPPPTRRITRALAANNTSIPHSTNPTPPLSPTPTLSSSSTSSLLQIDPLFLTPSVHPTNAASSWFGIPGEEAAETRRLLTTYVQKQEESVRGYEAVLAKLMKAQRLRDEVLEMCKAEGHVGEMSDGEDWIDFEHWGLQPTEVRKGRDEDEDAVEENTIGGRKGKRRARN